MFILPVRFAAAARLLTTALLCLFAGSAAQAGGDERNFGLPAEGTPERGITTAAQPSPEQLEALAKAGFTTVINLRTDAEMSFDEGERVKSLGMDYHRIPIGSAGDVNEAAARQLDAYLAQANGPVLVHCASSNRVGALFAVREHLIGADAESALAKGKAAGLASLEARAREVIEQQD